MQDNTISSVPKAAPGVTRADVERLSHEGHSPRSIARLLDISTQAVYQHLARIRKDGEQEAS